MSEKGFVDPKGSNLPGLAGRLEALFRQFKMFAQVLMSLPIYSLAALVIGLSLSPSIWLYNELKPVLDQHLSGLPWAVAMGVFFGLSFFLYGITMCLVVPVFNLVLVGKLRKWRGPYYSLAAIKWYIHNGATYLLRYTFLELVTPSPISLMFYKSMGMKIGKGAVINSTAISDPSLIEIGEESTVGGSAVIIGHYGQNGFLVLSPTVIGRRVTIGLRAIIMGGVTIGDNAKILANSVVLPRTIVPSGETWGGVPAKKIES